MVISAIGALVLVFGIYSGSVNGCFGNFAFGGVSCSLWSIPVPEVVFYIVGWGVIIAGIGILVLGLLMREKHRSIPPSEAAEESPSERGQNPTTPSGTPKETTE